MKPVVLIAEDDPLVRKVFKKALIRAGFDAIEAGTGRGALELLEQEPVDLALVDLRLPDMDGEALADRARRKGVGVPMVAVSGHAAKLGQQDERFVDRLLKPVEPSRLVATVRRNVPERPSVRGDARVLLVEDDRMQARLMRRRLEDAGFQLDHVWSGEDAIETARSVRPDAVLSDVLLPGIDGFEVCRRIRAEHPTIPVVLVSSLFDQEEFRRDARRAGASTLVARTSDAAEAIEALREALGERVASPEPTDDDDTASRGRVVRLLRQRSELDATHRALVAEQAAQLAALAGVADVLAHTTEVGPILTEALARYQDTGMFRATAVWLGDRELHLAAYTPPTLERSEMATLSGRGDLLERAADEVDVLVAPGDDLECASIALIALRVGGRLHGVAAFGLSEAEPSDSLLGFLRAVKAQLATLVALSGTDGARSAAERRFNALAEHEARCVLQTGPEGTIAFANSAARRIGLRIGHPVADMLGLEVSSELPASVRVGAHALRVSEIHGEDVLAHPITLVLQADR